MSQTAESRTSQDTNANASPSATAAAQRQMNVAAFPAPPTMTVPVGPDMEFEDVFGIEEERNAWLENREAEKSKVLNDLSLAATHIRDLFESDSGGQDIQMMPEYLAAVQGLSAQADLQNSRMFRGEIGRLYPEPNWLRTERMMLEGREDRFRADLLSTEIAERRILAELCSKGANEILVMREALVREHRAQHLAQVRQMERDVVKMRVLQDEEDLAMERYATQAKQKRCERLNLALTSYALQNDRIRHRINALESTWQFNAKKPIGFSLLIAREMKDEEIDRLYLEAMDVQQRMQFAKSAIQEIRTIWEWQIEMAKERRERRAIEWAEAQHRVLLQEKETIGCSFRFKSNGQSAGSATPQPPYYKQQQPPYHAREREPYVVQSSAPPEDQDFRPRTDSLAYTPLSPPNDAPAYRSSVPKPSNEPAHQATTQLPKTHPVPHTSHAKKLPTQPVPPAESYPYSSHSSRPTSNNRPDYRQAAPKRAPAPAPASAPRKPPTPKYLVHVESFVTEVVKQYRDAEGQIVEVVETKVDERRTLVPAEQAPSDAFTMKTAPVASVPNSVSNTPRISSGAKAAKQQWATPMSV